MQPAVLHTQLFCRACICIFMCLAKTGVFHYVYELSKGRSTETAEVENKVWHPQNMYDESGACPGLPGCPCYPAMIRRLLSTHLPRLWPRLPIKAALAIIICNLKICTQKARIKLPNPFTWVIKQPSDDNTSRCKCQKRGERLLPHTSFLNHAVARAQVPELTILPSGSIEVHCQGWKASVWLKLFMTAYFAQLRKHPCDS